MTNFVDDWEMSFAENQSSEFWMESSKEIPNLNIAPIGTASFFVIAVETWMEGLSVVRNYKKDIVDSGLEW